VERSRRAAPHPDEAAAALSHDELDPIVDGWAGARPSPVD
jgi:hypothetical protein